MRLVPLPTVLGQRRLRGGRHLGFQRRRLVPTNARPPAGAWLRRQVTGRSPLAPAGDRTQTNAKGAGCLGLAVTGVHESQQPLAEDSGVLLHAVSFAPLQLFRKPL